MIEEYKSQKLAVLQLALGYIDDVYSAVTDLPENERYNITSQLIRAETSIPLNIAEGSTGQSDAEQHRFLGLALRSHLETIACLDLIEMRSYLNKKQLQHIRIIGHQLFMKLIAFRKRLKSN